MSFLRAQLRSLAVAKKNKAEGIKAQKGGHKMWTEVTELAELIRCALLSSLIAHLSSSWVLVISGLCMPIRHDQTMHWRLQTSPWPQLWCMH